jgi:hypothetical protein
LPAIAILIATIGMTGCSAGGANPTAANCAGSRPLPQQYTATGPLSTRIQFLQAGCSIGISSIEVRAHSKLVRKVVFNPALPAGSLAAGKQTEWKGSGSFRGTGSASGPPGALTMTQEGTYQAVATIRLSEPQGGSAKQWATGATASSQFDQGKWSAAQAIGAPTGKAWAPLTKDGTAEWLELTYAEPVTPTGIDIWEGSGPGFVTKVEAFDDKKTSWTKLWQGTDPTSAAPKVFSPPLAKTSLRSSRIRLTINTAVPDWNQIDAVALAGAPRAAGQVIWIQGSWVERGKQTVCLGASCKASPLKGPQGREWAFAFNTASGKVGTTPDQVR